jgi:type IV pilus modification protein PilV
LLIRKEKGFSLLEVLVGLVFLAIGLLAIASLQVKSVQGNFFSNNLMQATYLAQDRLEFLKNQPYATLALGNFNDPTVTVPVSGGIVFNRSYSVTQVVDATSGNYLRIDYTVNWNDGVGHTIRFSTLRSQ